MSSRFLGALARRAAFPYVVDLPDDFVPRRRIRELKRPCCQQGGSRTVAVTTALLAPAGTADYVANQLCRDPDIRFEFTDCILLVEIGKERHDLTGPRHRLIETLDPEGKRLVPGYPNASEHLRS